MRVTLRLMCAPFLRHERAFMLGQLCPSRRRHRDAQSGIYPREDCNRTRPGSAMDEAETKTPHFNADGGSTEERAGDIAVR